MNNLMLVEVRRVTMFRDKRVLNVLLNGFGVMMVYAGMMGGAMVMVSLLNFVHFILFTEQCTCKAESTEKVCDNCYF